MRIGIGIVARRHRVTAHRTCSTSSGRNPSSSRTICAVAPEAQSWNCSRSTAGSSCRRSRSAVPQSPPSPPRHRSGCSSHGKILCCLRAPLLQNPAKPARLASAASTPFWRCSARMEDHRACAVAGAFVESRGPTAGNAERRSHRLRVETEQGTRGRRRAERAACAGGMKSALAMTRPHRASDAAHDFIPGRHGGQERRAGASPPFSNGQHHRNDAAARMRTRRLGGCRRVPRCRGRCRSRMRRPAPTRDRGRS